MRMTMFLRAGLLAAALALAGAARGGAASAPELAPFDARSPAALRATHAGRPFVLVFWSTTCDPCLEELPRWAALARRYPEIPIHLVLLPLSGGEERAQARRLLADLGNTGLRTAAVSDDDALERVLFAVDPAWRGELPAAFFLDAAHGSERRLGRVDPGWVEAWMKAKASAGSGATARGATAG